MGESARAGATIVIGTTESAAGTAGHMMRTEEVHGGQTRATGNRTAARSRIDGLRHLHEACAMTGAVQLLVVSMSVGGR